MGFDIFQITGRSMSPLLEKGTDAVIVVNVPFEELHQFDIIAYQTKNNAVSNVICHRVYKINPDGISLLEKGDHHFEIKIVLRDQYIGKVSHVIKNGTLYSLENPKNKKLNHLLGVISFIYSLLVKLYLCLHPAKTMEGICADKEFRNRFFSSYRFVAKRIISNFCE